MEHNGFEYIDLGLPSGTLWATMNVGANNVNDCGLFFPFLGEVGFTVNDILNQSIDISASKESDVDAVNLYMGGDWRTPTKEDIDELVNAYYTSNLDYNKILKHGDSRTIHIQVNGKYLLFPMKGYVNGKYIIKENSTFIWSATSLNNRFYALTITNSSEGAICLWNEAYPMQYGHNLRGVITRRQ